MAESAHDADHANPKEPSQPTRRALIASVAALVAGALAKAGDRPAEAGTGLPWILGQPNAAQDTTGLSFVSQLQGQPAVEIDAVGEGIGVRVSARAFGVTTTAELDLRPAIVALGRPAVIGGAASDAFPTTLTARIFQDALDLAEEAHSGGVFFHLGDAGTGLLGIQVPPETSPSVLADALGATITARVPAGLSGFSEAGVGVHARIFGVTGTAAFFEAPAGGTAAMLKGHLFADGAAFGGDVEVNGTLFVRGVPVGGGGGGVQASGEATILKGVQTFDVLNPAVTPSSFIDVMFFDEPRPKDLAVSHIQSFPGGFRVFLSQRPHTDIRFKWVALPC